MNVPARSRALLLLLSIVLAGAGCRPRPGITPSGPPPAVTPAGVTPAAPTTPPTALPSAAAPAATATGAASALPTTGAAFGKPVALDVWTSGAKLGVGTACTYDQAAGQGGPAPSRVWFTLTGGAITDLLYPTVGQAAVRELSLLVAGPDGVQRETDVKHPVSVTVQYLDPRALAYRVTTHDAAGRWQAVKEVVTDPAADSLITRWVFTSTQAGPRAYAYFVPHLGGSGRNDRLAARDGEIVAWDEKAGLYSVLLAGPAAGAESVGYLRRSDGLTDLQDGRLDWTFDTLPTPGYGAATLALPAGRPVTLVVGFGASEQEARAVARSTLDRGFDAVAREYVAGWHRYLDRLTAPPAPDALYWVSAMVLKAHEDKTAHGAGVASLSAPWGECLPDKDAGNQGYRFVWPRDLYHVATAFVALGDTDTARAILAYLDDVMQEDNGSFPQNTFLDGRTRWGSLQMDEVADPILLAGMLGASDRYQSLVKPAAGYIAAHGPYTMQERWEEIGGYVPHSIAAQVAALIVAAGLAEQAGDGASAAAWRATADEWEKQIEAWTFTTTGSLGNGRYYLRFTPKGDPDQAQIVSLANGAGMHPMQDILDVSALELVRLGVRAPGAAPIADTLPELDQALMEQTPNGPGWHRYSFDAYGEPGPGECSPGKGWLWPLFNGERGHYALAAGDVDQARAMLLAMQRMANQGLMLPEQVLTATGEGGGSATPLAWAHAEYILLARSIQEGRVFDRPASVAERYGR